MVHQKKLDNPLQLINVNSDMLIYTHLGTSWWGLVRTPSLLPESLCACHCINYSRYTPGQRWDSQSVGQRGVGILGPHKVKEGKQLFLVDSNSTLQFLSTFAGTDLSF